MKIKKLVLDKSYVSLKGENIEFKNHSINIICGENGCGKTTFMNEMVYGNSLFEFDREDEMNIYLQNKSQLFTYIPQNVYSYKTSVRDYLTKGNKDISLSDARRYMNQFMLNDIQLEDCFDKLSGGEKVKLSIIAALLKGTPYIFMDEPTNHLDNQSVEILIQILEECVIEKTFIIISHDQRLKFKYENIYFIENNSVMCPKEINVYKSENHVVPMLKSKYRFSLFENKIVMNYYNLVMIFIFACLVGFFVVFNDSLFLTDYSYGNDPGKENVISTYNAEYPYDEYGLNYVYSSGAHLEVKEENYEKNITYYDLKKIAQMENVSKIYVLDENVLLYKLDSIYNNQTEYTPTAFSMPEDYINVYNNLSQNYLDYFGNLKEGRYPSDGQNEICVPITDLSLYNTDVYDAIGKTIELNNQTYEIVGLLNNEMSLYLSSFDENHDNGFYTFSKDTIDDFLASQESPSERVEDLLIYTTDEKTTLNTLVETYPATNYDSFVFGIVTEKQYNKVFILSQVLPLNLSVSIIFSAILVLIKNAQMKIDKSILCDYSAYYVDKKTIKRKYLNIMMIMYIVLMVGDFIWNNFYSQLAYANNWVIMMDMLILCGPSIIFMCWKLKRDL